jgi:hypothetical protein
MNKWIEKKVRRPRVLIGLAAAGIGVFLFWPLTYISRVLHGKYNPLESTVSQLELGPGSSIEKATFLITGLFAAAFTLGLYSYFKQRNEKLFVSGILFLILIGITTCILAVIPPISTNTAGPVHTSLAVIILGAFPFSCFFLVRKFKKEGWHGIFIYTIIAGILGSAFGIGDMFFPESFFGLAERLTIANGMVWFGVVGTNIIRHVVKKDFRK